MEYEGEWWDAVVIKLVDVPPRKQAIEDQKPVVEDRKPVVAAIETGPSSQAQTAAPAEAGAGAGAEVKVESGESGKQAQGETERANEEDGAKDAEMTDAKDTGTDAAADAGADAGSSKMEVEEGGSVEAGEGNGGVEGSDKAGAKGEGGEVTEDTQMGEEKETGEATGEEKREEERQGEEKEGEKGEEKEEKGEGKEMEAEKEEEKGEKGEGKDEKEPGVSGSEGQSTAEAGISAQGAEPVRADLPSAALPSSLSEAGAGGFRATEEAKSEAAAPPAVPEIDNSALLPYISPTLPGPAIRYPDDWPEDGVYICAEDDRPLDVARIHRVNLARLVSQNKKTYPGLSKTSPLKAGTALKLPLPMDIAIEDDPPPPPDPLKVGVVLVHYVGGSEEETEWVYTCSKRMRPSADKTWNAVAVEAADEMNSILAPDPGAWLTHCTKVLKRLKKNDKSWPFWEPVDLEEMPDYHDYVSRPMWLDKIEANLLETYSGPQVKSQRACGIRLRRR